jgi:hypothetical protein
MGEGSAQLVRHGAHWWLHTPLEHTFSGPAKAEQQVTTHAQTRLCAVDLNITKHLAVCIILTVEGTVVATRFIKGGRQLHGLRKRQLGRIARNRRKTHGMRNVYDFPSSSLRARWPHRNG